MDIVHPRVAGIDVHKKVIWVAVRLPGAAPGERKVIVKSFKTVHPHNCFTPEGGSNSVVYCEERDAFRIHRIDLGKMEVTKEVKVAGDPRPFAITKDEARPIELFHMQTEANANLITPKLINDSIRDGKTAIEAAIKDVAALVVQSQK